MCGQLPTSKIRGPKINQMWSKGHLHRSESKRIGKHDQRAPTPKNRGPESPLHIEKNESKPVAINV